MNRLLALLFKKRGYSSDYYESICQCNHPEPAHIDEMCAMLKQYHDEDTQIALLTDFDMDGLMSGVVGYAGMKELGFNVVLAYPDVTTGYGIDAVEIDRIKAQYPKASVLITGDVGITAYDGVARARELGMDVLVTDHHIPKEKNVDANVIVDPQLADDPAFNGICGAHVLYLVLRHYAFHYTDNPVFYCDQIDRLRVFAGFGTISDSMPMLYENRQLVKDALHTCRTIYNDGSMGVVDTIPGCEVYRRAFVGLYTMLSTFVRHKKFDINTIQEDFIGFYAAPTFNSIKRLSGTVETAYKVFFGSRDEANACMEALMDMNEERKARVESTYVEMCRQPSKYAPFLHIVETTPGLCGLLAQKVRDRSGYPSVVVVKTDKGYRGSGRSPEWYPFLTNANGHSGWEAAGHEGAFGISFQDESALEAFAAFIRADVEKMMPDPEMLEKQPDFVISTLGDGDTDIDISLFMDFLDELSPFHPFGPGFEAPNIILRFDPQKSCKWSLFGNGKHIRAELRRRLNFVCFDQGHYFESAIDSTQFGDEIEVAGQLALNTFNGKTKIQFMGKMPEDLLEEYQSTPPSDLYSSEACHEEREVYRRPIMNHDYTVKGQKLRVWEIQSQCIHDGKEVWTPSIVEAFVKRLERDYQHAGSCNLRRWAWCLHDKDVYTDAEFEDPFTPGVPRHVQIGSHKADHIHLVLEFKNPVYNTSLQKKTKTILPIGCFREPEASYDKFMAITTYLSHMKAEEQAMGKHRYADDEIHCGYYNGKTFRPFDYAAEVNKYLRQTVKINKLRKRSPRFLADQFINKLESGEMDLEEVKAKSKEIMGYSFFLRFEKEFKLARMEYIKRGYEMKPRMNIYIYGGSGAGKSTLSRYLARALYPNYEDYECFYTVGAAGVRFDDYEYQPVIIWEDVRGSELIKEYKREGILNLMEPAPKKRSYNIKFGKITLTHQVNIFTSTEPFEVFAEELMGEYKDGNQTIKADKDTEQLFRRIPVRIILTKNELSIYKYEKAFNPQSGNKSEPEIYARIPNCNIALLNSLYDYDAITKAFFIITQPMVDLYNEFMTNMGTSEGKYLDERDAPKIRIVEGKDVTKLEAEYRESYFRVCKQYIFGHAIDVEYDYPEDDNDEDFFETENVEEHPITEGDEGDHTYVEFKFTEDYIKKINMFGPYEPEPEWRLGEQLSDGLFKGCYCPFTYVQWEEMGRPLTCERGSLRKDPYYIDTLVADLRKDIEEENRVLLRKEEIKEYLLAKNRGETPVLPEGITQREIQIFPQVITDEEFEEIFGNLDDGIDYNPEDDYAQEMEAAESVAGDVVSDSAIKYNSDWINEYKKALTSATNKYCESKSEKDLSNWAKQLFGTHQWWEIEEKKEAWECLKECWKKVRTIRMQEKHFVNETEWYADYQSIISLSTDPN